VEETTLVDEQYSILRDRRRGERNSHLLYSIKGRPPPGFGGPRELAGSEKLLKFILYFV